MVTVCDKIVLTDEDIDWLCGLSEAAEAWEPISNVGPGNFSMPVNKARPSKRRRNGNLTAIACTLERSGGALPSPTSTDGTGAGRKRKPGL